MVTLKSPPSRAFAAPHVHPRPRKRPPRCTLDCGFKTSESPALRGFVGERAPIRGTSLYLVLKSNGLHHSENLPVKFGFSPQIVPANIVKKLPPQRCSKPFFNFSHKRPTFAFTGESRYTLGFRKRIAHKGLHGETGAFPPSSTAWSCAASEIALSTAFVTLDSAVLLYTYISRFSVTPHYQQQLYLRPSFIPFFNFSYKRSTFVCIPESGYTLGSAQRIAHNGSHGETGAFQMGALLLPSACSARSRTSPGRVSKRRTLPLWGLGRGRSRRTQKAFGTAMRSCASLSRGVAAPLGCVIFFHFCRNCDLYAIRACAR